MTKFPETESLFESSLPGGGSLRLELAGPAIVRLRISHGPAPRDVASYAITRHAFSPAGVRILSHSEKAISLRTTGEGHGYLNIECSADPFSLKITDAQGHERFRTAPDGLNLSGERIQLKRNLTPRECLYGLGEHGETFNRNPGHYRIWNKDEATHHAFRQYYCTIPFGVSLPGEGIPPHGFLVDNPGEVRIDAGMRDPRVLGIETHTGDLDLWLLFEETPAEVMTEYADLTGRMRRPPLWALGYQQCRWSYMTSKRVREIAQGFRNRRIPCDVVYMDIDYMEKFRVFTWNSRDFADYEVLLQDLIRDNFSPLCIIDPGVAIAAGYEPYEKGIATEGFFLKKRDAEKPIVEDVWPGPVHHPDFTNPETRRLWGEWQFDTLLQKGIAGVWNDMNEPAIFQQGGGTREYPGDAIHNDHGQFRTHREVHNIYGQTMAQASCEGQLQHAPENRPFTLTRSGWAGIQRHSAVWTGDNRSAWSTMAMDIALNLNMGMSGVAFVGCDIGGFAGDATPELFARWMEWGVFQPFCRGHSAMGTRDQEPWAFGQDTERIARAAIELRYRLMPYVYTQFVEASETGIPVNRPLALEYWNDATVASIGDQFLLGPDLLVAPVLEPGKSHRLLYLPAGEWVHFWNHTRFDGGRWITVEAPFGQTPLFVKAGAVIPMWPLRQHLKGPAPETVFLDVYPGARLHGRLVEDDGATMQYEQGQEARVLFSGEETAKGLKLSIGAPQGPWRSPRKEWTIRLHRPDRTTGSVRCGNQNVEFEREGAVTTFTIPDRRKAETIEVDYVA